MENNFDKLKKIMAQNFGVPADEITQSSDLVSDLNLSNLEINDLITVVTKDFDLIIPGESEIGKMNTVSDLINLIDTYSEEL